MSEITVYKVVHKKHGEFSSAYVWSPGVNMQYQLGKTVESKTPLFCFINKDSAHEYFLGYNYTGAILEGTTTTQPIKLRDHHMLSIYDVKPDNVEQFWNDELTIEDFDKRYNVWWDRGFTRIYDDAYGIYDFTPTKVIAETLEGWSAKKE